jgi:uncharacterized protein (DUF1697 family)
VFRHVAFLRGIGLGNRRPQGAQLVRIFESLGYVDVASFMASGNVLLSADQRDGRVIEKRASRALKEQLGYEVDVFVRPAAVVATLARSTPFPDENQGAINVNVTFFSEPPAAQVAKALTAVRTDYDRFKVADRELYWLCRGNMSASTVWQRPEVQKLHLPNGTMRNMRTLQKLTAKYLDE